MVISAHQHFSNPNSIEKQNKNILSCKQVALALGVAESTVGVVIADWNQRNDGIFTLHQNLGSPKLELDENITSLLCIYIVDNNKNGN